MSLTFKEVAEILKLIDASDCDEVVLELEGVKLAVRRGGAGVSAGVSTETPPSASSGPPAAPSSSPKPAAPVADVPPDAVANGDDQVSGTQVRAPMVGTLYRRPSPDKPVFVEEGGRVEAGEPLCLIEVMKLYTTIDAPVSGQVVQIAAEDGALVEFDQVIFVIKAD